MKYIKNLYKFERLKWDLIEEFDSISLNEIFHGSNKKNREGVFYQIYDKNSINIKSYLNTTSTLKRELKLVKGIGVHREKKLRKNGLKTLEDLIQRNKFEKDAKKVKSYLEENQTEEIYNRIEKLPTNDFKNYVDLINIVGIEKILFLDVENLGFGDKHVFLIGIGYFKEENKDDFIVKQLLARSLKEEKVILREFIDLQEEYEGLISFNGKRFDMNQIRKRCNKYGLEISNSPSIHLDLLSISRKEWANKLENCKLSTIEEKIIETDRDIDLPSQLVPHFYDFYLRKENIGPLVPIINHNKKDLMVLPKLLQELL